MSIEKEVEEQFIQAQRVRRGRALMAYHRKLALEQVQIKNVNKG